MKLVIACIAEKEGILWSKLIAIRDMLGCVNIANSTFPDFYARLVDQERVRFAIQTIVRSEHSNFFEYQNVCAISMVNIIVERIQANR
jgi:hypothetical protein